MKIAVAGLWHLGSVISICLAEKGFAVTGYDPEKTVTDNLNKGITPLFEPGLEALLKKNLLDERIRFTSEPSSIADADCIWIAYDTPVDEQDNADTGFVEKEIVSLFPYLKEQAVVLISSQMPVGSVRKIEQLFGQEYPAKKVSFACSPENLRLGKAIDVFMDPDRIVVGVRDESDKIKLTAVLEKITDSIVWMGVESAEMTKHAVNAFLATSVVFINELAVLCEYVGADAQEVEKGLKSEFRIGPKAYLRPGNAFAGGTLARDVTYLIKKQQNFGLAPVFFSGIINSNENHKNWAKTKLLSVMGNTMEGKTIGMLGLTYKPGTDTLRRSTAIELCFWLDAQHAKIIAYDPALQQLPSEYADFITLANNAEEVIGKSDAVVVGTECAEFKEINMKNDDGHKKLAILDANGFLEKNFRGLNFHYISIGRSV